MRGTHFLKAWSCTQQCVTLSSAEAELVAMIGQFLTTEGMEDADEDEYKGFAGALRQGALDIASAVRQNDVEAAQKGLSIISQSCNDCHDGYQ